jgi:hypothetical protein
LLACLLYTFVLFYRCSPPLLSSPLYSSSSSGMRPPFLVIHSRNPICVCVCVCMRIYANCV